MKHLLTFLLIIYYLPVAAQHEVNRDKTYINFGSFLPHVYTLPKPKSKINLAFTINNITVIDSRFDTSTLGFMQQNFPDTKRILQLNNGTINSITTYILTSIDTTNHIQDTSGYTLVCIIKKLWLSDEIYKSEIDTSWAAKGNDSLQSGIIIRFDFFAGRNDGLIPLYRFDSTITGKKHIYGRGDNYLAEVLSASIERLNTFTIDKLGKAKKIYSWPDIEKYNEERFKIPILLEKPEKGVFMSFDEFRNNKPSIKQYKISPGKKTDELYYVDESGKETLLKDVFGYSDGENVFLASGNNFFKLYRTNNTFNIWGAKNFKKRRNSSLGQGLAFIVITDIDHLWARLKPALHTHSGSTRSNLIWKQA